MTLFSFPIDSLLLLGPTGAGKTPLGDALAHNGLYERRCHHLDFGAELRRVISGTQSNSDYSAGELEFIHGVLEQGLLLKNEHFPLAEKIIRIFLLRVMFRQKDLLVLNGIPRHEGQAGDMERIAHVHALIVLDCSAEAVTGRIRSNIGGDRSGRVDDVPELIERKLIVFKERTAPLIAWYERRGRPVFRVAVTKTTTPDEAYGRVSAFAAVHPPVTFVAEPPKR